MAEIQPPSLDSLLAVDGALSRLLRATLRRERLATVRDEEIAALSRRAAPALAKASLEIASLESLLERYYVLHPPAGDVKHFQLANGLIGSRAASNPALVPLSAAWTWDKIAAAVKAQWKSRYFHAPKPPTLNKVKIKAELDAAELKKCGLALDESESFYYELNRLAPAFEDAA